MTREPSINVECYSDSPGLAAQYEFGPFGEVFRATGPMAKASPFEAKRRSEAKDQPRFDALGNNCRDFARGIYWFAWGARWRENAENERRNGSSSR
jgi:hypothetical protein